MNSWFVYLIIYGYFKYAHYLNTKEKLLVALIPACIIYVIIRILSGFHLYTTDRNGITMRGVLRRRFIPWMDITAASTAQTRIGSVVLILETNNGTVKIDPRGFGSSTWNTDSIVASTWQHLRRFGHADGITLSENALKLWEPIPDNVPEEMEWGHPASSKYKSGAIASIAFFAILMILAWFAIGKSIQMIFLSLIFTVCFAFLIKLIMSQSLHLAYAVNVKRDGLQTELLFEKTFIAWIDITYTLWFKTNSTTHLVIKTSTPKREVLIPFTSGDAESEMLIMSIFRHLRIAGMKQPIILPEMYSQNPDALTKNSSGRAIEFTYINMLPQPARTHVRRLLNISLAMMFLGTMMIFAFVILGGLERIAPYLFALPHDRFFINGNMIPPSFCLMFGGIVFSAYLSGWLVSRMAGAYQSEWKGFIKVGVPKKFTRVFIWFMLAIGIVGILISPLYMNRYIRISDAGIAVNPLMGFKEKMYAWNQVKGIESRIHRYINKGEPDARYTYTIRFSDGTQWQFNDNETVTNRDAKLRQATEFIASKIGKPMEYVDDEE